MESQTSTNGVRRFECKLPVGEILPGEAFEAGIRVVAPPIGRLVASTVLYCIPGGQSNLKFFDLGDEADRRFSFADAMAMRGLLTVIVDHPGIGGTTRPNDDFDITTPLLTELHTRTARAVLQGLRRGTLMPGLPALPDIAQIACGHSMGSVIAIECQAHDPQFAGLILMGYGTGGLPDFLPRELAEATRDPDFLQQNLRKFARKNYGAASVSQEARPTNSSRRDNGPDFHSGAADPDGKSMMRDARAPLLVLPGLYSMLPGVSDRSSGKIDVPVLIVTGTHDFIEAGETLRRQFAGSTGLEIVRPEDTGHNLFIFPSRNESFERIAAWVATLG